MQVLYSPIRLDEIILYEFNGDVIVAHLNNEIDTFDFTGLEDGELESIVTTLPINPVISAKRENGELHVTLLYFHGPEATEKERFPTVREHTELEVGVYRGENKVEN